MDRRTFLRTTTAAAATVPGAAAAALPAPALVRGPEKICFLSRWTTGVPVLGDAAARLARRLEDAFDGRFCVVLNEPATGGVQGDLSFGTLDLDRAREPGFAFFAGLPGSLGLTPAHLQAWLAVGGGQLLWDDLAAHHGTKPLLAGHTGAEPGLWAARPLAEVRDLADAPVAVAGLGSALAKALGARPVGFPPEELCDAFSQGRLAAAEWGNQLAGLALGLPGAASIYYRGGFHRAGVPVVLDVNLALWERLGASGRTIVEGIAAQELALALAEAALHRRIAEETMAGAPGLLIADLPARIAGAVDLAGAALVEEFAAGSVAAARVRDSYLAMRRLLALPNARIA